MYFLAQIAVYYVSLAFVDFWSQFRIFIDFHGFALKFVDFCVSTKIYVIFSPDSFFRGIDIFSGPDCRLLFFFDLRRILAPVSFFVMVFHGFALKIVDFCVPVTFL